jgi:hypothetical protein
MLGIAYNGYRLLSHSLSPIDLIGLLALGAWVYVNFSALSTRCTRQVYFSGE